MADAWDFIAKGIDLTIQIAFFAIILGDRSWRLIGALGRLSRNPIAYGVSGFYTSFFRGTPLIVQMFLIAFALPQVVQNLGLPSGRRRAASRSTRWSPGSSRWV